MASSSLSGTSLCIHIIYVKGTVAALLPLLGTLVAQTDCKYRLVSNACTAAEEAQLAAYVKGNHRLSFHSLDCTTMVQHHEALAALLHLDDDEFFAFLDSDMVATGPFLLPILLALQTHDAVFTGLPMWHELTEMDMPKAYKFVGGRFLNNHQGQMMGLSYGAFYRRKPLLRFMEKSGIDLRRYYWKGLPTSAQRALAGLGMKKHFFDTAKACNILWQESGAQFQHVETSDLIHFGGISGGAYQESIQKSWVRWTPTAVRRAWRRLRWLMQGVCWDEVKNLEWLMKKRQMVATQLGQLVYHRSQPNQGEMMQGLPSDLAAKITSQLARVQEVLEMAETQEG